MDSHAMFLNCPAYMDKDGGTRCGLPAEVEYRYTMNSTDGPLESAKISCPRRHHFNAPIEYLTLPEFQTQTPGSMAATTCAAGQGWAVAAVAPQPSIAKTPAGAAPTQLSAGPTAVPGARAQSRHPITTGIPIRMACPATAAGERTCDGPNASATCTAQPTTNTSGASTAAGRIRDGTFAAIAPSSPRSRVPGYPCHHATAGTHWQSSASRDVPATCRGQA